MSANDQNIVLSKGGLPAIVERFQLSGLHGYKTVTLESKFAATILIAKNGSGKTTLLATLDAFLKRQFSRLGELEFHEISCRIRGIPHDLVLNRRDVFDYVSFTPSPEIAKIASDWKIDAIGLTKYITEDSEIDTDNVYYEDESEYYSDLIRSVGFKRKDALNLISRPRNDYLSGYPSIEHVDSAIKFAMQNIEILYLPTYRRIELPLVYSDPDKRRRRRNRVKLNVAKDSLYPNEIQFGLSDISERLYDLNQSVLSDSNIGYRKISVNIVSDMLDGTFDKSSYSMDNIPDKDELTLFFSRLREGRYVGPYAEVVIPDLDRIYSATDISDESSKFLRYYLTKLETVIRTTKGVERSIEEFITNCNKYLGSAEPSTNASDTVALEEFRPNGDEKVLRLNRANLSVSVESKATGRTIALDALSSGEKQMVSLFAKMYLYPGEKIVLIDEPELSLSIDWQRQILVDLINADQSAQIIAITHSPFVFENELDPYARSLKLNIDWTAAAQLRGDEE